MALTIVPEKIAVVRANAVGDFFFVLPALQALKETFPSAELVYLGKRWHKSFLEYRSSPVDRVEPVPFYHGVNNPPCGQSENKEEIALFFERMQKERFDLAFQLHGGGGFSNPFTKSLGARRSLGLQAKGAPPLDLCIPYKLFHKEVIRYLEVVQLVDATTTSLDPQLEVTEQDLHESYEVVAPSRKPLVILHPGATDPCRRWPPAEFAKMADWMIEEYNVDVFINAIGDERRLREEIVAEMKHSPLPYEGSLSLNGLYGLIARSSLLISNDSGPFHMACALRRPVVGIFWAPNVITSGPLFHDRRALHISWRMNCAVCGQRFFAKGEDYNRCEHEVSLVADVEAEEVLRSARSLLSAEFTKGERHGQQRR